MLTELALRHDLTESTREVLKGSTGGVKRLNEWKLSPSDVRRPYLDTPAFCQRQLDSHVLCGKVQLTLRFGSVRSGITGRSSRKWRQTSSVHLRCSSRCRDEVPSARGFSSSERRRTSTRRKNEQLRADTFRT